MSFKVKAGLLATLISTFSMAGPAFADTTLQGFICDSRGNVTFAFPTTHDKRFVIPGANRVAALTDANAQGPVGVVYDFNPPIPFQFITWYYKEAKNSNALAGMNVKYCIQRTDGTDQRSVNVPGGSFNRGGSVGDGWSDTVQDTRVFPQYVYNGNAVVSRIAFIFRDKNNGANNITLGRISINNNTIGVDNLITTNGDCSLKDNCTKEQNQPL